MEFSETIGLPTDTSGVSESDNALFYAKFTMCPLELTLNPDTTLGDTLWELQVPVQADSTDIYEIWRDFPSARPGCNFINTGCVVLNVLLSVRTDTTNDIPPSPGTDTIRADIYTHALPPYKPSVDGKFLLWAFVAGQARIVGEEDAFWPGGDTSACLVDTVPEKATTNRFYSPASDIGAPLVPPMDETGMNLYPNKDFWIELMLQPPYNVPSPADTFGVIILHVWIEAAGG